MQKENPMQTRQILFMLFSLVVYGSTAYSKDFLKFTGGPTGGTFQYFSNAISVYLSKNMKGTKVSNQASNGSTENLRKVNGGRAHFGVVHSGDLYLGRQGKIAGDPKKYEKVYAMAVLYKSAVQLAVLSDSKITDISELKGKKVGLGGPGSGAAATAERYFTGVGMWDKIDRQFLGYSKAAAAVKDGHIDAMWVVSGFPTKAIIELAATRGVTLIDLFGAGQKNGVFTTYPFYKPITIAAGTYDGIKKPYPTFADSTLWVAGAKASETQVYNALKEIFNDKGLKYLKDLNPAAGGMSIATGITGISTPLHPGAIKFWKEAGVKVPKHLIGS